MVRKYNLLLKSLLAFCIKIKSSHMAAFYFDLNFMKIIKNQSTSILIGNVYLTLTGFP